MLDRRAMIIHSPSTRIFFLVLAPDRNSGTSPPISFRAPTGDKFPRSAQKINFAEFMGANHGQERQEIHDGVIKLDAPSSLAGNAASVMISDIVVSLSPRKSIISKWEPNAWTQKEVVGFRSWLPLWSPTSKLNRIFTVLTYPEFKMSLELGSFFQYKKTASFEQTDFSSRILKTSIRLRSATLLSALTSIFRRVWFCHVFKANVHSH